MKTSVRKTIRVIIKAYVLWHPLICGLVLRLITLKDVEHKEMAE